MGSDATVYVFNYDRYRTEVVPAAKHLFLTGEMAPWWAQAVHDVFAGEGLESYADEMIAALTARSGLDLDRYCTYLDPDLALRDSEPMHDDAALARLIRWDIRACRSVACPMRRICPFHIQTREAGPDVVEEFNEALADAIAVQCLGKGHFVGRSRTATDYRPFLVSLGMDQRNVVHDLCRKLSRRGFVVGYLFANGDGVHGWLTPDETRHLVEQLDALPLPRYAATLAAAHEQWRQFQEQQLPPDRANSVWEALSLSFMRTVAAIAVNRRHGVLWGNDLPALPEHGAGGVP